MNIKKAGKFCGLSYDVARKQLDSLCSNECSLHLVEFFVTSDRAADLCYSHFTTLSKLVIMRNKVALMIKALQSHYASPALDFPYAEGCSLDYDV